MKVDTKIEIEHVEVDRRPVAYKDSGNHVYVVGKKGEGGGHFFANDGSWCDYTWDHKTFSNRTYYTPLYAGDKVRIVKEITL